MHTICALGDAAAWPVQGKFINFKQQKKVQVFHLIPELIVSF